MTQRNRTLYDALRHHTKDAVRVLREQSGDGKELPYTSEPRWKRVQGEIDDSTYTLVPVRQYHLQTAYLLVQDRLSKLPEYQRCKEELERDETIASQLYVPMGFRTFYHVTGF